MADHTTDPTSTDPAPIDLHQRTPTVELINAARDPLSILGATVVVETLRDSHMPMNDVHVPAATLWTSLGILAGYHRLSLKDIEQVFMTVIVTARENGAVEKYQQRTAGEAAAVDQHRRMDTLPTPNEALRSAEAVFARLKTDGKVH